jgi:Fe-S cluster assembly iron-binding protein IscA
MDVNVDIIHAGCAGSKITVTPRIEWDERISADKHLWITAWIELNLAEIMDWAQIARAKWKYYLVSEKIQSRCGCGTSFSFEKKIIPTDLAKIHRLQGILKMSPEVVKMWQILAKK